MSRVFDEQYGLKEVDEELAIIKDRDSVICRAFIFYRKKYQNYKAMEVYRMVAKKVRVSSATIRRIIGANNEIKKKK